MMNFIIDNPETEKLYQKLLLKIQTLKNGEVSDQMTRNGLVYKVNWGVSIPELRQIAHDITPDHLLALKLWNKQWRETMILATLTDEPAKVTEEQMDFRTKGFENTEIAEQASANLWVKSRFAFVKALEWSRGKKHIVRYTGIHLTGRLALIPGNDPDEMFEPVFDEFLVLARDRKFANVLYRSIFAIASRSEYLKQKAIDFTRELKESDNQNMVSLAKELEEELTYIMR
jgi:hypothetical protein